MFLAAAEAAPGAPGLPGVPGALCALSAPGAAVSEVELSGAGAQVTSEVRRRGSGDQC